MPEEEERRSYTIMREDFLLLYTRPITKEEAVWLYRYAYNDIRDREARARYLEEYGNVLDVSDYVERLRRLGVSLYYIIGVYESFGEFMDVVDGLRRLGNLRPEARQILEELLGRVRELLWGPTESRLAGAPVRYFEAPGLLVAPGPSGVVRAWPERLLYGSQSLGLYGISVFRGFFSLWRRDHGVTGWSMAVVRRDVDDKEVVAALANDDIVQGFLRENADAFREVLREHEKELTNKGYDDVVRKAKVVLATAQLLTAGLREEGVTA